MRLSRSLLATALSLVLGAGLAVAPILPHASARSYSAYDPSCPPAAAPDPETHPTRVMITGDSMSNGYSGDWTWRYLFSQHLSSEGVNVDLVGSLNDVVDPVSGAWWQHAYVDCDFDQDHDARVSAQLASWLNVPQPGSVPAAPTAIRQETLRQEPDVVVEFLGFNDLTRPRFQRKTGRPYTVSELVANVRKYVAEVRAANPSAALVLATVASDETDPKQTFRTRLKKLAAQLDTSGSRVVVADVLRYWGGTGDTWDRYHPNSRGERHIAQAMADAFAGLGLGGGAASIPPASPVGPRTVPVLKASAAIGRLTLAWKAIPGATRMLVYCREPAASGAWTRHRDVTITTAASSNRVRLTTCRSGKAVVRGRTYQLVVRAAKGTSVAADLASKTLTRSVPLH